MYFPASVVYLLMVGKQELHALSEEDLMNEATVNHLRNQSRMLFQSLRRYSRCNRRRGSGIYLTNGNS